MASGLVFNPFLSQRSSKLLNLTDWYVTDPLNVEKFSQSLSKSYASLLIDTLVHDSATYVSSLSVE
jgi:hypothetical protein